MRRASFLACGFVFVVSSGTFAAQGAAESELLRQLQQRPTAFAASLDLAALYRDQGRTDDALRMLNRAASIILDERRNPLQPRSIPLPPGAPVRVGGDVREPRKIRDVTPVYPDAARARRLTGTVVVEFVIDITGRVSSTRVLRSSPPFDEPAIEAVRQWRYRPTFLGDVPVPVITNAVLEFKP